MVRRTAQQLRANGIAPRVPGDGSIFLVQTPSGPRWRATRTVSQDDQGRAVQVTGTGIDQQTAVARREQSYKRWLVKTGELPASILKAPRLAAKEAVTTAVHLDRWMTWKAAQTNQGRIDPSVAVRYRQLINNHITPHIGNIPVRLLSGDDIEKLLGVTLPAKTRLVKGRDEPTRLLGATPIRTVQNILKMSMVWGMQKGLLLEDPMKYVQAVEKAKRVNEKLETKHWIPEYLIEKLEGSEDEARWIFAFFGLRQSERLGIQWSSFKNLTTAKTTTLEIANQLARNEATGDLFLKPPKTDASTRIVSVSKEVTAILRQHKKRQDQWKKSEDWKPLPGLEDLAFTTKTGLPIRQTTDNKQWHALLKKYEIDPPIRQHAMRHIAISLMVQQGTPTETVSKYAGHANELITRVTYTHLSSKASEEPVNQLTETLFRRRKKKT
jgi:integrase